MSVQTNPPSKPTRAQMSSMLPRTPWAVVRAAQGDEAEHPLNELCKLYHRPLIKAAEYWLGVPHDHANDVTNEFIVAFLLKGGLAEADEEVGSFRRYVLKRLQNFVNNWWRKHYAPVRGRMNPHVSLDQIGREEPVIDGEPSDETDREFARVTLKLALSGLKTEFLRNHSAADWRVIKPGLLRHTEAPGLASIAAALGKTPAATKMQVSRLRARYRELIEDHVRFLVSDEQNFNLEMKRLRELF